jgi:cytidylate kinase
MKDQKSMKSTDINVVVSSWASSGGTTLALMIADLFELKYIYAGGVIKEWSDRMGYDHTTNEFHKWENQYGDHWDRMWENYIEIKLSQQEHFLCEGKTAGFFLPEGRAFEIMVIADLETRNERSGKDNRTEEIQKRDQLLVERWQRLFDINIMDEDSLEENYDLIIDNSDLSISESLKAAVEEIVAANPDYEINFELGNLSKITKELEKKYWKENKKTGSGKNFLKDRLNSKNLYLTSEEIFQEWKLNKSYRKILEGLPEEMQQAI